MMLFSLIQLAVQKVCSEVWQYLAASILGWLHFVKFFAEVLSGGTSSIVCIWSATAVDSHHPVSPCHGHDWPQILATFIYSRPIFTSAPSGTKFIHPADRSSMFLRNVQATLSSYKVHVPMTLAFQTLLILELTFLI
jgi:hypothetical protein